jgi:hypothetical protein
MDDPPCPHCTALQAIKDKFRTKLQEALKEAISEAAPATKDTTDLSRFTISLADELLWGAACHYLQEDHPPSEAIHELALAFEAFAEDYEDEVETLEVADSDPQEPDLSVN